MKPNLTPYLFYRLAGQLLALLVLYFALAWLLPIAGASLFNGMQLWNNAYMLYCWCVQFAFIVITVELRDTLIKKAAHWFTLLPRNWVRFVLAMAILPVLSVVTASLLILVQSIPAFSFGVLIELLLLLVQVWCLCGAAVPMSAKRFYTFFFHLPKPVNHNTAWQYPTNVNNTQQI